MNRIAHPVTRVIRKYCNFLGWLDLFRILMDKLSPGSGTKAYITLDLTEW